MAAATTKLTISLHHTLASAQGSHRGSWICCYSNSRAEELRAAVTESSGRCVLDVFGFGSVPGEQAGSGSGSEMEDAAAAAAAAAAAGCEPPGSGCLWWQTPGTGSTASPPGSHRKPCPAIALQT